MTEIKVGWQKTAHDQVKLHVIEAVARAVLGGTREYKQRMSVPQFIPAGLGSTQSLRQRGDTAGPEMVARLDAAIAAAAVTGNARDQARAEAWRRRLEGLDLYAPPRPGDRAERERVAEELRRLSLQEATARLQELLRYHRWLDAHMLTIPPGEQQRLDARVAGARMALELAKATGQGARIRGARVLLKLRVQAADHLRELTRQHRNKEARIADAKARVTTAKRRQPRHTPPQRSLPSPVYVVEIAPLIVTGPGITLSVPAQRLRLDVTREVRTPEQEEALRTVLQESVNPVAPGREDQLRRAPRVKDATWEAWLTLAGMLDVAVNEELAQRNCRVA
ncbi:hypothetical protein [Deinococcus fonticola]|uniref:hypothetical protein n=1 Tax=Deinococcus fonticola TaxID=2528713 RepID=UPI0010750493|nr:hypothetical protein [Deinococcus fonticola]